jgi:hypothetical protein
LPLGVGVPVTVAESLAVEPFTLGVVDRPGVSGLTVKGSQVIPYVKFNPVDGSSYGVYAMK